MTSASVPSSAGSSSVSYLHPLCFSVFSFTLRLALCLRACASGASRAGSPADKNLVIWYAILTEEICQCVDHYIMLTAGDVHRLQVGALEWTCPYIETHSAVIGLMQKQNNELPLGIDPVLRTLIFRWGSVNLNVSFKKKIIHTMSRWRKRISKFGECPSMAARTSNLGVIHHSPRDRVFRFLKSVHDFNSLVSSTCTLYASALSIVLEIFFSRTLY